ncbi:MAG: hypothetical protein NC399_07955 [Muribaculum sp.]|nr:hypothetical protein [Muribaculum sp.]
MSENKSIIIRFESLSEQTVGSITKIVGLVPARFFIPIIDALNLEANPRSAKSGAVTDAIQETIANAPSLFPFMSKGVLLASSNYERLERGRIRLSPQNPKIEGILDGGHNTLAIGLFILEQAFNYHGKNLSSATKNWDAFKKLWEENRDLIDSYIKETQTGEEGNTLDFLVPVELLVPRDTNDTACVFSFTNTLLEVCEARNNNAELQLAAKANQKGYFEALQNLMQAQNPAVAERIEWKTNEGGEVKVQDLIALAWTALNLIAPVRDENNPDRYLEAVAPNKLYSAKGSCLKQFEKLMGSPDVTETSADGYHAELINEEVRSAFRIAVELPDLYDYIYENFPKCYNANGGRFLAITACRSLNEKRKVKVTPFNGREIEVISPDGFVMPLFYGLQALLGKRETDGRRELYWTQPPMPFLQDHFNKIVADYMGNLSLCDYDPQKVGKAPKIYDDAVKTYKMALLGIL